MWKICSFPEGADTLLSPGVADAGEDMLVVCLRADRSTILSVMNATSRVSGRAMHCCKLSTELSTILAGFLTHPNPPSITLMCPSAVVRRMLKTRCSPVSSACAINSWWQCWVPDTHAASECKCAIFQTLLNQLYLQTIVMYRVDVTYWSLSQPHTCCGVFVTHWDESIYQSPNVPVWRTAGPTPMHRHTAIGYITASQIKSELRRKLIFWIWGC